MLKPSGKKRIIYTLVLLLCAGALLFSSCAPAAVKRADITEIYEAEKTEAFHSVESESEVYSSGGFSYIFDEKTMTLGVKSKDGDSGWLTLPEQSNTQACAASVQLLYKDKLYILNTQDNSVSLGGASFEKNENGVTVNYDMKTDADSETLVSFKMKYIFSGSEMTVQCDTADISTAKGAKVIYIDILPSFGASFNPSYGDYFIVPDGSGALMYTSVHDSATDYVEFDIYGSDPAGDGDDKPSVMPVFGNKHSDGAYAAYISGGDSSATVCAQRAKDDSGASVFARFAISAVSSEGGRIRYSDGFDGTVSITYMFLDGDNADYSHMAAAVREYMIRNSLMNEKRVSGGSVPFVLNTVGYYSNGFMKKASQTTFDDCETLINILKGKSINDITVIYKGIFSGGLRRKKVDSDSVLSSLGGKSGFENLYSFTQANGIDLAVETNLFSAAAVSKASRAETANGKAAVSNVKNNMSRGDDDKLIQFKLIKPTQIERRISDVMSLGAGLPCSYIALADAGKTLYSDFSSSKATREYTKKAVTDAVSSVSSSAPVTAANGNFYLLGCTDGIYDMPLETSYTQSDAYYGVPFAQMVIHGYVEYSGTSVNLSDNYKLYMLKCIEYGSLLSYEWVFDETSALYYGYTLNDAVEYYNELCSALGGLEDSTIISHTRIKNGVVCIKYENSAVVYVNYNNYSVITDDSLTVLPYSALRVG